MIIKKHENFPCPELLKYNSLVPRPLYRIFSMRSIYAAIKRVVALTMIYIGSIKFEVAVYRKTIQKSYYAKKVTMTFDSQVWQRKVWRIIMKRARQMRVTFSFPFYAGVSLEMRVSPAQCGWLDIPGVRFSFHPATHNQQQQQPAQVYTDYSYIQYTVEETP